MTSSDMVVCTLCHDEGAYKDAVKWCTECEVFLCINCKKTPPKVRNV